MIDDKRLEEMAFLKEWEHQQGAVMLKQENYEKEWKHTIARYFHSQGFRACEAKADKLAETCDDLDDLFDLLESSDKCDFSYSDLSKHFKAIRNIRKALSAYRGEKS